MTLANRLRDLRLNRRKTMRDLSEAFGVSVNTIYRWEHNISDPRKINLTAIASFYGVEMDWLLSGQDGGSANKNDSHSPNVREADLDSGNQLEEQLLVMYRTLSASSRHKIIGYVERMCLEKIDNSFS